MITQCSIRHLYSLQPDNETLTAAAKNAIIDQAKTFERRRCNHHELPEPLSTLECLSSVVDPKDNLTNKHRYVVATQEIEVRSHMRRVLGVPLIYINRSVMIMEPMAGNSQEVREKEEKGKFRTGLSARRGTKRKHGEEDDDDEEGGNGDQSRWSVALEHNGGNTAKDDRIEKKRKGVKAPNPLSMRKPKKRDPPKKEESKPVRSSSSENAKPFAVDETEAQTIVKEGTKKKRRKRKHGGNSTSDQATDGADLET